MAWRGMSTEFRGRSKTMASPIRLISLFLIAKSSKEQVGYERTSDTSGARLCRAPEGHPGRWSRHAEKYQNAFGFQDHKMRQFRRTANARLPVWAAGPATAQSRHARASAAGATATFERDSAPGDTMVRPAIISSPNRSKTDPGNRPEARRNHEPIQHKRDGPLLPLPNIRGHLNLPFDASFLGAME